MTDDTSTGFETIPGPAPETIIETEAIVDVAPVADPVELVPTVIEAEAMFTDNPGLAAVHTVDGILHRDGVLQRMAIGE